MGWTSEEGGWGGRLCGFIYMCIYIGGMPGGGVTGKGEQPRKDPQTLNLQVMVVQYTHTAGGPVTTTAV